MRNLNKKRVRVRASVSVRVRVSVSIQVGVGGGEVGPVIGPATDRKTRASEQAGGGTIRGPSAARTYRTGSNTACRRTARRFARADGCAGRHPVNGGGSDGGHRGEDGSFARHSWVLANFGAANCAKDILSMSPPAMDAQRPTRHGRGNTNGGRQQKRWAAARSVAPCRTVDLELPEV